MPQPASCDPPEGAAADDDASARASGDSDDLPSLRLCCFSSGLDQGYPQHRLGRHSGRGRPARRGQQQLSRRREPSCRGQSLTLPGPEAMRRPDGPTGLACSLRDGCTARMPALQRAPDVNLPVPSHAGTYMGPITTCFAAALPQKRRPNMRKTGTQQGGPTGS